MKVYKITKTNNTTFNDTLWIPGEWKEIPLERKLTNKDFCSHRCFHFYDNPLLAVLLNPVQGKYDDPFLLWEAEAEGDIISDNGLKFGCKKLRIIKTREVPVFTLKQKIYFGIICAKHVYKEEKWNKWADDWISNRDRATYAATDAADAAASAADYAADYAASAAAYADADAIYAASAATYAANSAATYAATSATDATVSDISLKDKAQKAYEFERTL